MNDSEAVEDKPQRLGDKEQGFGQSNAISRHVGGDHWASLPLQEICVCMFCQKRWMQEEEGESCYSSLADGDDPQSIHPLVELRPQGLFPSNLQSAHRLDHTTSKTWTISAPPPHIADPVCFHF